MTEYTNVTIFCDGACEPNPGKGGAGVVLLSAHHRKELWQALGYTTNQRAEISAAILAFEALKKPCRVVVQTDSQYLVRCGNREWGRHTNTDLWEKLDHLMQRHASVDFLWVKGHNGNKENERADALARHAASMNGAKK